MEILGPAACFGILIPPVAWLAGRYPLAGEQWWRNLFPIAVAGVLVCLIHPALYTGLDRLIGSVLGPPYSFHYRYGYAFVEGHPALPFQQVWWYVLTYYVTSLSFFCVCVVAFVPASRYYQLRRRSE